MKPKLTKTLAIMVALTLGFTIWAYAESQMPKADPDALWVIVWGRL